MGLFKTDIFRSFAIGFAAGAFLLLASAGVEAGLSPSAVPVAVAATVH